LQVTFHGAAGEVTGSQHLFEVQGHKVLTDCGLFQGPREEAYQKNRHPSYDPGGLDAVVVSHAHLDHTGKLPRLAKLGFQGPVYATPQTVELCDPLLRDSAFLQQKDLEFANKIRHGKGQAPFNLLYNLEETEQVLSQFKSRLLHQPFEVVPGMVVTYIEAGHVLGSAQILLELEEKGTRRRVGFTGDLGRRRLPMINDPEQFKDLDTLIIESTYGNRDHDAFAEVGVQFAEIIRSTYERGGKVIIPAFALERTQEMLYQFAKLREAGAMPKDMPIYLDSPLAIKCTEIFAKHLNVYDSEARQLIEAGVNPFDFPGLHYVGSVEESKELNDDHRPMVIVAASGMMEAGRILHHLRNNIEDSRNTILVVSFQAAHTLGRRIVEGRSEVNIFGEPFRVRAQVKVLNAFSGHAGRRDLLAYVRAVKDASPRLKKVVLVHGEPEQALPFKETLDSWRQFETIYPKLGDPCQL
jgi:metallo-beta-lactamase family protein